jgi:GMP synthase-like glutamine amidotransferase
MPNRVLILDGAINTDLYHPTEHWRALAEGAECVSVHLPSDEELPELDSFSHMIVTGSEASITVFEPWFAAEAEAVSEAAERGMPILASCFGHQILAWALSGPRFTRRSPTPELGWIEIETIAADPLLDGLPRRWFSYALHFDEVIDLPAPWRVLARSERAQVQVMRYGDAPIWGIQAHPEIGPDEGRAVLSGILRRSPELAPVLRPALEQEPRDDGLAREIVRRFLSF